MKNGKQDSEKSGTCETKCPYRLPIREMIAENAKFYESVSHKKPNAKGGDIQK